MPKWRFKSGAPPSAYAYPPPLDLKKKDVVNVEKAVLSTTSKASKLAAEKDKVTPEEAAAAKEAEEQAKAKAQAPCRNPNPNPNPKPNPNPNPNPYPNQTSRTRRPRKCRKPSTTWTGARASRYNRRASRADPRPTASL